MDKIYRTDVLVLGGGLCGYSAALRARKVGAEVTLLAAGAGASPNVNGFCAWTDGDERSLAALIAAAQKAGHGLNDEPLLAAGLRNSAHAYADLGAYGVPIRFDRHRILHTARGPIRCGYKTDHELGDCALPLLRETALSRGIRILSGRALAPLLQEGRVTGAAAICEGERTDLLASATVLAMGGLGRLFQTSTYPGDVAGSAAAFALMAGGTLRDMEFLSYEPAVVCGLKEVGHMPLPTAFYGKGCVLRNGRGERFLKTRYGLEESELKARGPLDKEWLSACIQREVTEGRGTPSGGVWYDCRDVEREELAPYARKVRRLAAAGVDLKTTPVEVRPMPHSHMGGVAVNAACETGVEGLFAGGEAAGGFFGAGRLAGFGGTSAVALGDLAGASAARYSAGAAGPSKGALPGRLRIGRNDGRAILACSFSLFNSGKKLSEGLRELEALGSEELWDGEDLGRLSAACSRMLALAVLGAAALREESRGCFLREDWPDERADLARSIRWNLDPDGALRHTF